MKNISQHTDITSKYILLLLATAVAGCTPVATATLMTAQMASLIHTDKTLTDHAVSLAMKQNCSILHTANNEPYCQTEQPPPDVGALIAAQGQRLYCYRTLGEVSCYERPDYTASGQTRVDFAYGMQPAAGAVPDLAAVPGLVIKAQRPAPSPSLGETASGADSRSIMGTY